MSQNKNKTNRTYEGLFLFGTAFTARADDALATVRGFIEKHGGTVRILKNGGDRKLAYEVEKQTRGLYVLSYFSGAPAIVAAVDREVRLSDDVLRCLITDASHLSDAEMEAAQLQKPEPRPERTEDDDFGAGGGGGGFRGGDVGGRPPRRRREESEEAETADAGA